MLKKLTLVIIILFSLVFFEYYITLFVNTFFIELNYQSVYSKAFFIIMTLLASVYLCSKMKIYNKEYLVNSLLLSMVYILLRIDIIPHPSWNFTSLYGNLLYFDVILLLPLIVFKPRFLQILTNLNRKIKPSCHKTNHIILSSNNNEPIEIEKDDRFGFYKDAKSLLELLINNKRQTNNGAFIIGLQGEWGKGKTSYLNMMRVAATERTENDVIVMRFNPWLNHSYNQLTRNFLNAVGDCIGDFTIKNIIQNYSKQVINADINILSKIISIVFGNHKDESPDDLLSKVSDKIGQLNKLLVIQVDDLDRLTGEEILNTIKLIRNVANFKSTVFIVAYDNEYIESSLNNMQIKREYLEKVFNVIYPLPSIKTEELAEIVKRQLKGTLLINDNQNEVIDSFMIIIRNNLSLRNAKKISDAIQSTKSNLIDADGELLIDLLDYMLLNYLIIINPTAYEYLASLRTLNSINDKNSVSLSGGIFYINRSKGFMEKELMTDEEYLKDRLANNVGDTNLSLTYTIFKALFDDTRPGISRISYVNSFPAYFNRIFDKRLIGRKEFNDSFVSGSDFFKTDLKDWNENYDTHALDRLVSNKKCDSLEEWKRFLDDLLVITPKSYSDRYFSDKRTGIIPEPGLDLLNIRDSKYYDEKKCCALAVWNFLFEETVLMNDTIDILAKKFTLTMYWKNTLRIVYIILRDDVKGLSEREVFDFYWKHYNIKGINYLTFNEDFWYAVRELYMYDKLEARERLKMHISEHIDDFIANYRADKIHYQVSSLFTGYEVSGNGATVSDVWIPHFIEFLRSIEPMTDNLRYYIEDIEKMQN